MISLGESVPIDASIVMLFFADRIGLVFLFWGRFGGFLLEICVRMALGFPSACSVYYINWLSEPNMAISKIFGNEL